MKIWLFIFAFLLTNLCVGQQTIPYFKNYTKSEYKGDNANWDITQTSAGIIYAANNHNLLEYNGDFFTKYQLKGNLVIRSVSSIRDTVYTGAYREFGYWVKDEKNRLQYHTLSTGAFSEASGNHEIWKIYSFEKNIVFQSFRSIFIYNTVSKKVREVKFPDVSSIFTFYYNSEIYLTTKESGIYRLVQDHFEYQSWSQPIENFHIQDMAPFKNGYLFATRLNGIFYYEEGTIIPWLSKGTGRIAGVEVNNISVVNNLVCLGTINNGLLVFDDTKNLKFTYNTKNGLTNNTVIRQFIDINNNIWLGLDNGFACIYLTSPISIYNDKSGELGTLYAIEKIDANTELLGSNRGLFLKNEKGLQFIEGSNGQVWELKKTAHGILCGHNSCTYIYKDNKLTTVSPISGGMDFYEISNNRFAMANYIGLIEVVYENGKWREGEIPDLNLPVNQVFNSRSDEYWLAVPNDGVTVFRSNNADLKGLIVEKHFSEETSDNIFSINGDVYVSNQNNEIFRYDPVSDTLAIDQLLIDKLKPFDNVSSFDNRFVITKLDNSISIYNLEKQERINFSSKMMEERLVQDFDFVKVIGDDAYFLLDDGYIKINLNQLWSEDREVSKPHIASLQINNEPSENVAKKIPFKRNSIQFRLSNYNPTNLLNTQRVFRLKGYDDQWKPSVSTAILYENLPAGDYTFQAKNVLGASESEITSYSFTVLPPWFFSTWAWMSYVLAIAVIIYFVHIYNKRRYRLKQVRFEREMLYKNRIRMQKEKMESNKAVAELEKDKLKEKLQSKSRELASYAASMAKKEELLDQLEDEIKKSNIQDTNTKMYDRLKNVMDRQAHSEDDWKLFERNFNEVHDEFFQKLQVRFPKLTPKDLNLCAYLKMNLSSKEIAPLIGITYRSVELHRYRLRKKLKLGKNDNLVKFLLTI